MIPTSGHKRNTSASTGISSLSATLADDLFSSSDSEGASSITTPSPSSSRCPSPSSTLTPTCRFSLVPRGAPFPDDVSLNDIDPTDALLFFPDANAEPSRAILLVGPAIARHMHNQRTGKAPSSSTRSRARMHPYRIIVRPSRGESDESCSISRVLRGSRSRRSSCNDVAEEQPEVMWREWSRGRHMDREVSRAWRNLVRPRSGSALSTASSSSSFSD